jgi:hypothetical protein
MKIESINEEVIFTEELLFKLRAKKLHLICPAKFKNSFCTEYLVNHLGMSVYEVEKFCDAVNRAKDPGCLYPMQTITLFPIEEGLDLNICLESVWMAQTDYFKCPEILVVFDKHDKLNNQMLQENFTALFKKNENINVVVKMYFK